MGGRGADRDMCYCVFGSDFNVAPKVVQNLLEMNKKQLKYWLLIK